MGEIALQSSWGVLVALYLFLGGLAAGTGAVTAAINLKWGERFRNIVRFGSWAAAILLVIGVLCLLAETTMPLRAMQLWRAFTNPTSWMTIGAWLLVAGIAVFGLFALVSTPALTDAVFRGKPDTAQKAKRVLSIIALPVGVCIALYTGILIGVLVNHPLWNSWIVPVLFTVSAFDTGVALIAGYLCLGRPLAAKKAEGRKPAGGVSAPKAPNAAFAVAGVAEAADAAAVTSVDAVVAEVPAAPSEADKAELGKLSALLERASIGLVVAELVVLAAFLLIANGGGEVGALSVWVLTAGPLAVPFWAVLIVGGLLVPLVLEILMTVRPALVGAKAKPLILIASALVLIGGCVLRFLVLYAGLPLSL